jgi:hypothetical protein
LVAIVSIATKYGILQHILCVALGGKSSSGWSVKDGIDGEALERILGSFRWLTNLWFILLTSSTFISVRTYFLYNHTSSSRFAICGGTTGKFCEGWMGPILMGTHIASVYHHVLPYVVVPHESHVRDGWDLIPKEPTVASVSHHILPYVNVSHCEYARQGSTSFKRSVPEVGRCPRSDKRMGVVSIVNGNVCGRFHECWHERFIVFCDLLQVH